jgi:hypothetical protein
MVREKWEEIVAYYRTYIGIIQPLLMETRVVILEQDPEKLIDPATLNTILEEENKRTVSKVKVIAEFNAFFRNAIFTIIQRYTEESKENFSPLDIKDYIIDFLDEAVKVFDILLELVSEDQNLQEQTLLYIAHNRLSEIIFPKGEKLDEIYAQLIKFSPDWFEAQRYILRPTGSYKDEIGEMEMPGLSPKVYQIINNITSLFNLDPNYMDMPENPKFVIPTVMVSDVFEPYIDKIANAEEESVKRICERMELRIIDQIFIGPSEYFLQYAETHNYFSKQEDADGKIRWIPQFSNETLVLMYLAKACFRRGFLSKELVNWIAINFSFIIYNAILHAILGDDNIFYNLFLDMKTEEKILPYLMKILCFDKYLRIDRMKIRDSPGYRKEIFSFLGSKIEAIDKLTYYIIEDLKDHMKFEDKSE